MHAHYCKPAVIVVQSQRLRFVVTHRISLFILILQEMSSPRGFKSHLPYHMLPGGDPALSQAKYIYVYRNPKDAVVSGYYHTKGLLSQDATWDTYFDKFLTERVVFGPILDHVLGWWKNRGMLAALWTVRAHLHFT